MWIEIKIKKKQTRGRFIRLPLCLEQHLKEIKPLETITTEGDVSDDE